MRMVTFVILMENGPNSSVVPIGNSNNCRYHLIHDQLLHCNAFNQTYWNIKSGPHRFVIAGGNIQGTSQSCLLQFIRCRTIKPSQCFPENSVTPSRRSLLIILQMLTAFYFEGGRMLNISFMEAIEHMTSFHFRAKLSRCIMMVNGQW